MQMKFHDQFSSQSQGNLTVSLLIKFEVIR